MIAAGHCNIKYLPREFYHDATFKDNEGWTVAMWATKCM